MALNTPDSAQEIDQRSKVDVKRELPISNPFLRNSWLGSIITAVSNRIFDFFLSLNIEAKESLPDTAVRKLERWAAIWGITRTAATQSIGNLVVGGTDSTVIPNTTGFSSPDGEVYNSTSDTTIVDQTLSISSLTRAGTTATLTTASDHLLASNIPISISGANPFQYNVSGTEMIVTGDTTLTFTVSDNPATPATGTMFLDFTSASVSLQSEGFGTAVNQDFDTSLSIQTTIANVDTEGSVDFGGLTGGVDQESDDSLRLRLTDRIQNPVSNFNESQIESLSKTIAGTTRTFVQPVIPNVGETTVYFMRDGDENPIPAGTKVNEMKTLLDTIRPANMATEDFFVLAPSGVLTDFVFTDLQPSTLSMQDSVTESLQQFFAERTSVGITVDTDAYRSSIFNTIDVSNGDTVATFELSAPPGDIVVISGEIAILGNTTYP